MHFEHLEWEIQPFQLYSGGIPSPIEWLLNPEIKEKYKNKSSFPICYYLLSYNSFTAFLSKEVKSTKQMWDQDRITPEWSQIANGNAACSWEPIESLKGIHWH